MQSVELDNATARKQLHLNRRDRRPCQEQDCKHLCKRIVYTLVSDIYAFGSRSERSGERLPKAARDSIEARNAAVE